MKKIIIVLLSFFIFLDAHENKKVTLQLSWLHQFQFAGYYMAKEKGFYSDVDLDVNLQEVKYNMDLVSTIENNDVDFAISRSSLIIDKMNGRDVLALGAIYQHSPMMLLVKDDGKINSAKDLLNKKIMMTKNARKTASIQAMLNANKLSDKDLNIIAHSFNLDDLISGKTDAMASYLSNEPIRLKEKDIKYKILHPRDYGFDFYNDILFTSNKFKNKNPKLVKDFYDASIKGWHYAFENITETAEIIYKKYNTQNKSLIHLIKEGEILKTLAYHEDGDIGCLEKERLEDIVNVFKVLGLVNKSENLLDGFIYEENNHKKMTLEYTPDEKNIFILSVIFLFIIFLISMYFIKKIRFDKNLLDSVINGTDDLIYYKDKNFKYLGCNKAFEEFVGKPKSLIIGKTIFELMDKDTSNIFSNVDKSVLEKNISEISTEWVKSSNGKEVYIQNKKTPFKYNMKDIGVLGICRDLTKVKQLEDEHLKQQKTLLTQSKIVAMGEMIGNIAHQWRQPLSVITTSVSSLKLLLDLKEKEISADQIKDSVEMVLKQSETLTKTIDDFENFFNQDSNEVCDFNIKESLLMLEELIANSFLNDNIKIVSNLVDVKISNNEKNLIQAFVNICNNTKDALLINNIPFDERYLFISLERVDDNIKIIFKDSAGGIDKSIMDKLFEPYFTTKYKSQGTGIGLYMTHQIISKQFSGVINFENVKYEYEEKSLSGVKISIVLPS